MSSLQQLQERQDVRHVAEARIGEFRDFVPVKPGELYVQVSQCRTVYHTDGTIRKESAPAALLIEQMIHAYNGTTYRSGGTLNANFDDAAQAESCASAISTFHGSTAAISGTQLSISIL